MKLEQGAHVAQIISAIAVVVSILYLAHQVGENTTAIEIETARGLRELQFQGDVWDQDPAHVALMLRGDSLPDSLTPVEWRQYARRWSIRHSVWSLAHLTFLNGAMDRPRWEGWDRSYSDGVCIPGRRRFWDARGKWYDVRFQAHVDSLIAEC